MPQRSNIQIARLAFVTMATPLGILLFSTSGNWRGVRQDVETGAPEQKATVSMRKPLG